MESVILSSPALVSALLLALGMAVFYLMKKPKGYLLPILSTGLSVLAAAEAILLGARTEEITAVLLVFLAVALMHLWRQV